MSLKQANRRLNQDERIETKTRLAQGQLFTRFVMTLLLCFVLIQLIVTGLLIYQQHFQAKQMMSSLKVEYQRFLVFESAQKLEHVLTSYPDKLQASAMMVISQEGEQQRHVAGFALSSPASFLEDKRILASNWLDFVFGPVYLSIKLSPEKTDAQSLSQTSDKAEAKQEYWLLLHVPTKLTALVEKWLLVAAVLSVLSVLISLIVWRLLKTTLQPLHVLASGLDNPDAWQQHEAGSGVEQRQNANKGLAALNQGVNQVMSQLKGANASMSHTLDAIAHDLKTPLSRILLTSEKALARNNNHQVDLVDALADCAESASQANQLLTTLMKINDEVIGRHDIVKEEVSLKEVVTNVASWYEEIAEEKGIRLLFNQADDIRCVTDPKRLTQVLVNLVDNSIKYSEQGGDILLSWGEMKASFYLSVKDTGIGIEKDKQEAIFERLYRVDHSRTQAGYGLGLAMVKVMLTSLNAHIKVTSELGQGSEFCILLPCEPESGLK